MDEPILSGGAKSPSARWKKVGGILVVVLVIGLLGFFNWRQTRTAPTGNADEDNKTEESVSDNTANYPDLALLSGLQRLELAKDFESWTPDSKISSERLRNLRLTQQGNISEAYVYVRAQVEDKPLTKYDSLYLKFNGQGGHLFRLASLAVPESGETQVLYPLEKISYLASIPYDENRQPSELNAQNFFGPEKTISVYSFLSSWRPGKILELSIYYGCREQEICSLSIK